MGGESEIEMVRLIAIALVVRVLQFIGGILAMIGIAKGHWPESVLALLFCLAVGGQIPKPRKE